MLTGLLMLGIGGAGAAAGVVSSVREHYKNQRQTSPEWQIRAAQQRVDAALAHARVDMEVAAGVREPGETRMADSFGSWNGWL
jgi:hypothetical protein